MRLLFLFIYLFVLFTQPLHTQNYSITLIQFEMQKNYRHLPGA